MTKLCNTCVAKLNWNCKKLEEKEGDIITTDIDSDGYRTRYIYTKGKLVYHSKFLDWTHKILDENQNYQELKWKRRVGLDSAENCVINWNNYNELPIDWSDRIIISIAEYGMLRIPELIPFPHLIEQEEFDKRTYCKLADGSWTWFYKKHLEKK